MNEINYPKKYALMRLKEFVGYDPVMGIRDIRTYAYVVAECYLINEEVVFEGDRKKSRYEVVFIWEPFSNRKVEPQYTPNNYCINSSFVERVFDDLEEVIKYREYRNYDLRVALMMKSDIENVYKVEEEFLEKLNGAYELESRHLIDLNGKVKERTKKG